MSHTSADSDSDSEETRLFRSVQVGYLSGIHIYDRLSYQPEDLILLPMHCQDTTVVLRTAQHGIVEELIISTLSAAGVVLFAIKFTFVQSLTTLFIFDSIVLISRDNKSFTENVNTQAPIDVLTMFSDMTRCLLVRPICVSYLFDLCIQWAHQPYPFFCWEDKTFL